MCRARRVIRDVEDSDALGGLVVLGGAEGGMLGLARYTAMGAPP
jgi:hypothetical protein